MKQILTGVILLVLCLTGCQERKLTLLGAGATFPAPLYKKMIEEYPEKITIRYTPLGSSGGIQQIKEQNVDFGASDAFLTITEMESFPPDVLIHLPTCVGGVAVTFNLPEIEELRLTGEVLAEIYLGEISLWNDRKIELLNPGLSLPNQKILPVYRLEGSGTSNIFTDYLTKVSPRWKEEVGVKRTLFLSHGLAAKGNQGVAFKVKKTPYSISYISLEYALSENLPLTAIRNKSGNFIIPGIQSLTEAANIEIPPDCRIMITDTPDPGGYPIAGFTWLLVYSRQNYKNRSESRAVELSKLLWWMTHEGQVYCRELNYAPLPPRARNQVEYLLYNMNYKDKLLLKEWIKER